MCITWVVRAILTHLTSQWRAACVGSLVHVDLPDAARTASTRFRWWQPQHEGEARDQWAVDEVLVASYRHLTQLQEAFDVPLRVRHNILSLALT